MSKTSKLLYVVGIGPGSYQQMTIAASKALQVSDVLIGYTVYIDLLKEYYPEKRRLTTAMSQEVDRCKIALKEADKGHTVSFICSGDSGVYGMSGLILDLAADYPEVVIEIIPGVTAACAGAAILGAPLIHDFAVISLSDLLTPMEKIEKRLEFAAMADFAICLYNPSSKKRADYLKRACDLISRHQPLQTVCGIAKNIGRDGEQFEVMTLELLAKRQVDMFTTVFIGNSQTKNLNGKMVTPRGYKYV